ncbi:MAG: hypothetical protein ACPG5T_01265 [Endozoicomonas sp.]
MGVQKVFSPIQQLKDCMNLGITIYPGQSSEDIQEKIEAKKAEIESRKRKKTGVAPTTPAQEVTDKQ